VPPPAALPEDFPIASEEPADVMRYVDSAIASRPETRIFQFDLASLQVELAQATNQLLPELNLALETSQDVGEQASSKGDKSPNKIEAGIYGEVPLQRRGARGKIDSLNAKMRQVQAKLQFASDMIANEVQQIIVARDASQRQIKQAETNLKLANEALRLGTIGLREGEFTLPILNIYEQAVADAEAALLVAKAEFFIADSLLRIASGQELDSN
jgi:outer membrane protein TolC